MIRLLLSVFLLTGFTTLYAGTADTEANCSVSARGTDAKSAEKSKKSVMNGIRKAAIEREVNLLIEKLGSLEEKTSSNNIWSKVYSNYHTYQQLKARQEKLLAKIFKLKSLREPTRKDKENLERYISELHTNEGKLQLLDVFRDDPFKKLVEPPKIGEIPRIGNPLEIISALSFMKKINEKQKNYQASFESLKTTIRQLEEEASITEKLMALQPGNEKLKKRYIDLKKEIETIRPVMEIYDTTKEVFDKKIEEIKLGINRQIAREVEKAGTIGGVLLFFFILFLAVKYLLQKYMSTKESFYTINKISNILFFTILIFTVLFAYIDNVNYLVTIMGFASAGIAIAMKDLFMSLMGWFAIIIGGSIHVGDRVKFVRDGVQYVGDIVDISLLRMTMQEDITLTTYMHNRRAGRIIFIPNNYIFTDMIANYSHSGLKTVWDGIDFMITFDSNISKATFIAKEVTKKYSRGYTDITRKQLNKLRSSYHLKNTNVEPRIFSFIEDYGIRISAWYLTNAFATLTLRSTISSEIIEKIQAESDIEIAYPTQSLYMDRRRESTPRPPVDDSGEGTEEMPS
jgi:small-conductance mechanosensitive channel